MARSTCGGSGELSALNSARSGCWPRPLLRAESDSAFRPRTVRSIPRPSFVCSPHKVLVLYRCTTSAVAVQCTV